MIPTQHIRAAIVNGTSVSTRLLHMHVGHQAAAAAVEPLSAWRPAHDGLRMAVHVLDGLRMWGPAGVRRSLVQHGMRTCDNSLARDCSARARYLKQKGRCERVCA